jgi:hypothetical protein
MLMSSTCDKFATAWVEHHYFGTHSSYLAAARAEMLGAPDYDENKHRKALEESRRVLSMLRHLLA